MQENREVMIQAQELMQTIHEAVDHMIKQLEELRYEETIQLLEDVVKGTESVQMALLPLAEEEEASKLQSLHKDLMEKVDKYLDFYRDKEHEAMKEQMSMAIVESLKKWHREMEELIKPHIDH
ncbi:hypothetical protein SAMN05192551_102262 [Tindallia magadiensis]|uniref:DUF8042 domain-containing protein n=1 Tax=Tindallia magadiensis TaxID=69895 RepID=A0A1I3C7S9_9FIRM|nr:hypothetical protein [Tindallia magadiensis]SFH70463.1 hypothetical protein SAMN05192551_102262 [Tindallia magadiensis]